MEEQKTPDLTPFTGPAGGWGSVRSLAEILPREQLGPVDLAQLARQNKPGGFQCVSCAWTKPAEYHPAEFCEEGAKATAWELTARRTTPDFFATHTLADLRTWSDYHLEEHGRLTHPLKYDPATDKYQAVGWGEAFDDIATRLKALDPKSTVFYASGRASLETSYMYALFARMYGHQNLPDSSNMCHESTSVGLKKVIGAPVGTCLLEDFDHCDLILFFGQNVGTNAPRMLHTLRSAKKRGCTVVTFNPLRERGLERFTDPQNPIEMATLGETQISDHYHQVKAGGDLAVLTGLTKWLVEADDAARAAGKPAILDHDFIAEHTTGFEDVAQHARSTSWDEIERNSGLTRLAIEQTARIYADAKATIGVYGMGLTQHVLGVQNVTSYVNLLLLKGNIGRKGAGTCPVRGHSNVQGQRTVGITEKTELAPVDKYRELYHFEPPTEKGHDTVSTCEGIIDGSVRAFIGLGGNFLRAVPDHRVIEPAWGGLDLHVQVATKLNRNHLFPAKANGATYLLPCLGRIEEDLDAQGNHKAVTMEDSLSCIHGSVGKVKPASPALLSEPRIVAELALRVVGDNPHVPWMAWAGDYGLVRDAIERTYPEEFKDFNKRLFTPGGFWKGNKAREREWQTESGKAQFTVPTKLSATGFDDEDGVWRLITLRSNDQFNTTVYGYDDRFRGIRGTRDVILMNANDIRERGLREGDLVTLESTVEDGVERKVENLRIHAYSIPLGCIAGYYPELNPLIALAHHAEESHVPAAKSVPVRILGPTGHAR
ncbi:molybdopterin-dependent oxidoreductase alpha subunit [Sphingomonas jejuensis]|uniref:Molybdopterin-dependent oxidoreductase alpha subunit n=1 Tax=Sphingomonas jejuensis TaxID=904715 RepID=A0ABX0XPG3_9SPHN|nr:FdhF/YdeP family oxidoreductase [Sphingomonas jejuensis]NJC34622.1 molybdopterin-dependent oxidoreductase alpha subunit [Sphingomonas jejuensis]